MKKFSTIHTPANWMIGFGVAAIVAGGIISAFLAHQPSEAAMWASAYLVLVVGVVQIAFGQNLRTLARRQTSTSLWAAFAVYNVANICVLAGTLHKTTATGQLVLDIGSMGLMIALLCMIYGLKDAKRSWQLWVFYLVALIIVVSAPIGVLLAHH